MNESYRNECSSLHIKNLKTPRVQSGRHQMCTIRANAKLSLIGHCQRLIAHLFKIHFKWIGVLIIDDFKILI